MMPWGPSTHMEIDGRIKKIKIKINKIKIYIHIYIYIPNDELISIQILPFVIAG